MSVLKQVTIYKSIELELKSLFPCWKKTPKSFHACHKVQQKTVFNIFTSPKKITELDIAHRISIARNSYLQDLNFKRKADKQPLHGKVQPL